MRCADCAHWITRRTTVYADGSRLDTFATPDGKGQCQELNLETVESFGCIAFTAGDDHVLFSEKDGAPWQHWHYVPCPECSGIAARPDAGFHGMCVRCAGIGKVRCYDDGFVGDEQTQMHPIEKARRKPPECAKCSGRIELDWKACPHCGIKLEPPSKPEVVPLGF